MQNCEKNYSDGCIKIKYSIQTSLRNKMCLNVVFLSLFSLLQFQSHFIIRTIQRSKTQGCCIFNKSFRAISQELRRTKKGSKNMFEKKRRSERSVTYTNESHWEKRVTFFNVWSIFWTSLCSYIGFGLMSLN